MKNLKTISEKIGRGLGYYVVDSTAGLMISQPFFASIERFVLDIPYEISWKNRELSLETTLYGLGLAMAGLRDASLWTSERLNILSRSDASAVKKHDRVFYTLWGAATGPCFYYASGGTDFKKALLTAGVAAGYGCFAGKLTGRLTDILRNYTGLETGQRLPSSLTSFSQSKKIAAVGGAVALSLIATLAPYSISPKTKLQNNPSLERVYATPHETFP